MGAVAPALQRAQLPLITQQGHPRKQLSDACEWLSGVAQATRASLRGLLSGRTRRSAGCEKALGSPCEALEESLRRASAHPAKWLRSPCQAHLSAT